MGVSTSGSVRRRSVMRAVGLGLGAGLVAEAVPGAARAQGVGMAATASPPNAPPKAHYWTGEYWAKKGDVSLYMYRKRLSAPQPGEAPKPMLFLVHGEHDGIATEEDLLEFFRRLPNRDRQFVVLAHAAHSVALGINRHHFWHVMRSFLTMPPRLDA